MKTATPKKPLTTAAAPAALRAVQLPPIGAEWPGEGGIFAGILKGDGEDYAVIVPLDPASDVDPAPWKDAIRNAASFKSAAHKDYAAADRRELALCFHNVPELFKKEWYWTATPFAGDESFAWFQSFLNGLQLFYLKVNPYRARAVRRLILR